MSADGDTVADVRAWCRSHGRLADLDGRSGCWPDVERRVGGDGRRAAVEAGAGRQQLLLLVVMVAMLLVLRHGGEHVVHVVPRLAHHCRHAERLTAVRRVVQLDDSLDYLPAKPMSSLRSPVSKKETSNKRSTLSVSARPFLWSPYVIGQTIIFLPCDFYLYGRPME